MDRDLTLERRTMLYEVAPSSPAPPHYPLSIVNYQLPLAIQRAAHAQRTLIEHMGVDHGGADIFVAEEFLDGANVIAVFQEVGGEGMTEGVTANVLG